MQNLLGHSAAWRGGSSISFSPQAHAIKFGFPYKLDSSFKVSGSTARHERLKQTSRLSAKNIQLVASLPDNWSIMKEDLQLQTQVALQLEAENLKQAFRRPQPRQVLSRVSGSTVCF